jgi:hypothetical protein
MRTLAGGRARVGTQRAPSAFLAAHEVVRYIERMSRLALAALLSVASGCNAAGSHAAAESVCDPLSAPPATLATTLGAGQDAAGTVYLVDRGGVPTQPSVVRVFVASGGSLIRQHVIGSGEIGTSEVIETFQSADGSVGPRDLDVQIDGDQATSMTLGPEGSAKARIGGRDAGVATPLVLVDPRSVEGLPATDLPGSVTWVADSSDGRAIVVTAPLENDLGSAGFRLFYGAPSAMQERPIVSYEQALSGFPSIGFTIDSQTYVMAIASLPPTDGGFLERPGPVTLTGGGQSVPFTLRLPTPTTLSGFSFTCSRP